MKKFKSLLIAISSLALSVGAAVGVGLGLNQNAKEANAAGEWYYRGTDTTNKVVSAWGNGDADLYVHDNALETVTWPFIVDELFKFYSTYDNWDGDTYGVSSIQGNAASLFQRTGGDKDNLKYLGTSQCYFDLTLSSGVLYVNFTDDTEKITNFYYVGTDTANKAATQWTNWTTTPVLLNGASVKFTFLQNEELRFRPACDKNDMPTAFKYSDLEDGDFYGSFEANGNNIKCLIAGDYSVTITSVDHSLSIRIFPFGVDPDDTNFVYVLDKYGTNLNSYHRAYTYIEGGQAMGWPGATMQRYTDTTHMYKQEYWVGMENVIFNNKHGENNSEGLQSISYDLSLVAGKCLILDGSTTYNNEEHRDEWSSNTWVSPAVGKYIENCMHFANYSESQGGNGECVSEGWYTTAKNAYEAAEFADYREELCTLDWVVARLQAWARANGKTFTVSAGVGTFSGRTTFVSPLGENNTSNNTLIIIIASSVVTLLAIGGYFYLRKRKEDR